MSGDRSYWHHCGRCGALFLALMDYEEERKCGVCGLDPAPGIVDPVAPLRPDRNPVSMVTLTQPTVVHGRHHDGKRMVILKIIAAWLLLVVCIVLLARWMWGDDPVSKTVVPPEENVETDAAKAEQDRSLLEAALPECRSVLEEFLSTEVLRVRQGLVIPHDTIAERMERYHLANAIEMVNRQDLKLIASTVVHLPEGNTILTQWETTSGHLFDAAFRLVGSAWKLDWDHFVRHGSQDWPLFCAGSGPDEVEFRLLAREKSDFGAETEDGYSVVLYAPKQMRIADAGYKAPMLPMPRDGRDARLLRAAFQRAQQGKPLFGSSMRDINPQDMIRVRVIVRRIPGPGMPNFQITKVLACHWYASSAWGVDPDAELPAKSGTKTEE